MPNSKSAPAIQTNRQLKHCSQQLQTHATSYHPPVIPQQNSSSAGQTASQFRGNLKRVKDAETFQRQKERRQKKAAFLLDGTTTGPVVGVAKGGSWGQEPQQHPVRLQGGQSVQLPVRPNRSVLPCPALFCATSTCRATCQPVVFQDWYDNLLCMHGCSSIFFHSWIGTCLITICPVGCRTICSSIPCSPRVNVPPREVEGFGFSSRLVMTTIEGLMLYCFVKTCSIV